MANVWSGEYNRFFDSFNRFRWGHTEGRLEMIEAMLEVAVEEEMREDV